jgi:hypothetical protein
VIHYDEVLLHLAHVSGTNYLLDPLDKQTRRREELILRMEEQQLSRNPKYSVPTLHPVIYSLSRQILCFVKKRLEEEGVCTFEEVQNMFCTIPFFIRYVLFQITLLLLLNHCKMTVLEKRWNFFSQWERLNAWPIKTTSDLLHSSLCFTLSIV